MAACSGEEGREEGALTAVVWEEPSEGEGEGGGCGAVDHGGRWTHAAGDNGGRRHVPGAQIGTGAGWLVCGRVEGRKERVKEKEKG